MPLNVLDTKSRDPPVALGFLPSQGREPGTIEKVMTVDSLFLYFLASSGGEGVEEGFKRQFKLSLLVLHSVDL